MAETRHTCRVVMCDDAVDFLRIMKLLLEDCDIQIVGEASNGQEAVELCRREQPDILTLDISMPVMDGLTALPLVREASPGTKVVMLSGFGSASVRRQAEELGAVDFIEKGVDPLDLPRQLKAHC